MLLPDERPLKPAKSPVLAPSPLQTKPASTPRVHSSSAPTSAYQAYRQGERNSTPVSTPKPKPVPKPSGGLAGAALGAAIGSSGSTNAYQAYRQGERNSTPVSTPKLKPSASPKLDKHESWWDKATGWAEDDKNGQVIQAVDTLAKGVTIEYVGRHIKGWTGAVGNTVGLGRQRVEVTGNSQVVRALENSHFQGALKGGSRVVLAPLAVAIDGVNLVNAYNKDGFGKEFRGTAGSVASAWGGAAAGAAIGSAFIPIPVVGTLAGAMVGGFLGSKYGSNLEHKIEEAAPKVWDGVKSAGSAIKDGAKSVWGWLSG